MKRTILLLQITTFILFSFYSFAGNDSAKDTISFHEGLAARVHGKSGRSVVVTDPLFYNFITGNFAAPTENAVAGKDAEGNVEHWEKIEASDNGNFRSRKLRGGYLYLTYDSPKSETRILDISGHSEVYVNGAPRGGDMYNHHWVLLPVKLKKGKNIFLVKGSRGQVSIKLLPLVKSVSFTQRDMTIPDLLTTENDSKIGAIRIVNATQKTKENLRIVSEAGGVSEEMKVPSITPMTTRKVAYQLKDVFTVKGKADVTLKLYDGKKLLDETVVEYSVLTKQDRYSRTFVSGIDGSVQYFAVREGNIEPGTKPAMFLSLHGAGVQASGQAAAYQAKDWGHVICPTNRREFGFDWEDWGRWDAMEVQQIAEKMYGTDPERTYLTGHSMGGHGTWQVGVTFPGKWAAIAPLAGWYSFYSYGGKEKIENPTPIESMFMRASHPSNTIDLSRNYLHYGIYIQHGDSDKTVPVSQARYMRELLGKFHPDFAYLEHPGKPHWFGVDFKNIFDYFKWHTIPENADVKTFEFRTASPGVSASSRFVTLYQQENPFEFCGVKVFQNVRSEKEKKEGKVPAKQKIRVQTENLKTFKLDLEHCAGVDTLMITVDNNSFDYLAPKMNEAWFTKVEGQWQQTDKPNDSFQKNPLRYGNFKDAFRHQMVFVYSTKGTKEENEWSYNKARFDAETFYYRGNGAIDIIPDKSFSLDKYKDRSVILYGNASTNAAWNMLLADCPVQIKRGAITVDEKTLTGNQFGAYFIYPRKDSNVASVGVIGGSGMEGFGAVSPNRYFISGVGIPDLMIFTPEMYKDGFIGIKAAGYFGNDWTVKNGDISWTE